LCVCAIRGCSLAYDLRLVAASVGIAIGASMATLWFAFYRRGFAGGRRRAGAGHRVSVEPGTPLFAQSLLAYMIACGIAVLSIGNLSLLALLSMQNRSA
jgi:hypothetical protein